MKHHVDGEFTNKMMRTVVCGVRNSATFNPYRTNVENRVSS